MKRSTWLIVLLSVATLVVGPMAIFYGIYIGYLTSVQVPPQFEKRLLQSLPIESPDMAFDWMITNSPRYWVFSASVQALAHDKELSNWSGTFPWTSAVELRSTGYREYIEHVATNALYKVNLVRQTISDPTNGCDIEVASRLFAELNTGRKFQFASISTNLGVIGMVSDKTPFNGLRPQVDAVAIPVYGLNFFEMKKPKTVGSSNTSDYWYSYSKKPSRPGIHDQSFGAKDDYCVIENNLLLIKAKNLFNSQGYTFTIGQYDRTNTFDQSGHLIRP